MDAVFVGPEAWGQSSKVSVLSWVNLAALGWWRMALHPVTGAASETFLLNQVLSIVHPRARLRGRTPLMFSVQLQLGPVTMYLLNKQWCRQKTTMLYGPVSAVAHNPHAFMVLCHLSLYREHTSLSRMTSVLILFNRRVSFSFSLTHVHK